MVPDTVGGTEQTRKTAGSRYYWCCTFALLVGLGPLKLTSNPARRALLIVAAIQPDCFEMVLTRMLVRMVFANWIFSHKGGLKETVL